MGLRSWYAIDEVDEEIIALEETKMKMKLLRNGRKRVNACRMETKMRSTTMTTIQKTKKFTKQIQLFSYDEENPDDERVVEVTMLKSMKSYQMISEEVELSEEDDEEEDSEDEEEE